MRIPYIVEGQFAINVCDSERALTCSQKNGHFIHYVRYINLNFILFSSSTSFLKLLSRSAQLCSVLAIYLASRCRMIYVYIDGVYYTHVLLKEQSTYLSNPLASLILHAKGTADGHSHTIFELNFSIYIALLLLHNNIRVYGVRVTWISTHANKYSHSDFNLLLLLLEQRQRCMYHCIDDQICVGKWAKQETQNKKSECNLSGGE